MLMSLPVLCLFYQTRLAKSEEVHICFIQFCWSDMPGFEGQALCLVLILEHPIARKIVLHKSEGVVIRMQGPQLDSRTQDLIDLLHGRFCQDKWTLAIEQKLSDIQMRGPLRNDK